jgi:hypothetical protein
MLLSLEIVGCCIPVNTFVIGYALSDEEFIGCKKRFHTPLKSDV